MIKQTQKPKMQAAKKIFKLNSKNNLCKFIGKCNYDGAANTQKGIAYPAIKAITLSSKRHFLSKIWRTFSKTLR